MYKLRSLSGLLAFDAAARHCSLTLAAKELGRTQSAISQQVKLLEEQTGLTLFVRKPREVILTPEGRAVAKAVRTAFEGIERTVTEQNRKDEPNVLRLTTYQSFAIQWLIPRLPHFNLRHPEIDVRVHPDDQRLDLRAEGQDLAIRVGDLPAGETAMLPERFVPVYAPSLAPDRDLTKHDIADYPLLSHSEANIWPDWARNNDCDSAGLTVTADYSHSGLLVQAAAAGGGIALAPVTTVAEAVNSGRLKCIRGKPVVTDHNYFLSFAHDPAPEKVRIFADWMQEELVLMNQEMAEYFCED